MRGRALLLLALTAACSDSSAPSMPAPTHIVVVGRLERSATVTDTVYHLGAVVLDSAVTWTVAPGGAVTFPGPRQLHFVQSGVVTLIAHFSGDSLVIPLSVATPPLVYFDLQLATHHSIYRIALDGLDTVRITLDSADNTEPTLSAAGAMVFVSRRNGNGELYAGTTTPGAGVTRLTTTAGDEAAPRLSKDGSSVAYTIPIGGIPKLYRAAANLSDTAQFTASFESSGGVDASPTWSPDGSMLAFVSTVSGPARLYRYHLGGAFDTLPGAALTGADVEPAWSPDGKYIAFASSRTGPTELYLLTLSNGTIIPLTNDGGPNGEPTWTADGRVVYTTFATGHPRLRWLDPALPDSTHAIATAADAAHPSSSPAP
ncbi:MAG: hypothetical protein ACHQXA_10105 [Gemmatimonadales bacterium]